MPISMRRACFTGCAFALALLSGPMNSPAGIFHTLRHRGSADPNAYRPQVNRYVVIDPVPQGTQSADADPAPTSQAVEPPRAWKGLLYGPAPQPAKTHTAAEPQPEWRADRLTATPYPWGWFGAIPRTYGTRHTGYYGEYRDAIRWPGN